MQPFFTFLPFNHTVFRLLLPAFLLLFTACEKVLDIKLKDSEPRLIIEANLSDQPGPHTVLISQSVSFNAPNTFPQVSGAQVILSDNTGNSEVLVEARPGVYQTTSFQGVPGRTYTLNVLVAGKEYTAVSQMPQPVPIKTISVEEFRFDPKRKAAQIEFQEPAGVKNYYRGLYLVNDTLSKNLFFFSDDFNDGKLVDELFIDSDLELDRGDSVEIRLQSIDEPFFRFLREQNQLGNSQSTSPANPTSTFSNGALGYFSAHAQSAARMVVP